MGSQHETEHGIRVLKRHGESVAVFLDPGAFSDGALTEIVTDQVFSSGTRIRIVGKDTTEPTITEGRLRHIRSLHPEERKQEIYDIVQKMIPAIEVEIESTAVPPTMRIERPTFSKDFFAEFVRKLEIDDFKRDTIPMDDLGTPYGFETKENAVNSIIILDDFKGPEGK